MLQSALLFAAIGLALTSPAVIKTKEEIETFRKFLEGAKLNNDASTRDLPSSNPEENSGKFQGDIILDDSVIESLIEQYSMGRTALSLPNTKWPNNTVVWEFGEGQFNRFQQALILRAIESIEANTCVRFRKREPEDTNYVSLTSTPGYCFATVGYRTEMDVHVMNLATELTGHCLRHTTIIHEWFHILGFYHMQAAANRDEYIRINWDNVIDGSEGNFYIFSPTADYGVEYDYLSTMHYSRFAFSKNRRPTMTALKEFKGRMGQSLYVTEKDWLRVNRHYNCPGAWD